MLTEEDAQNNLGDWLRLHHVTGLGLLAKHALLHDLGGPQRIFDPDCAQADGHPRIQRKLRSAVQQEAVRSRVSRDLEWLADRAHHHILPIAHPAYPRLLTQIADPPLLLYVVGRPQVLSCPQLAVVGSRNPSPYGRNVATDFAARLARHGLVITSGLALGIDASAHRASLSAGCTSIAVLGNGLDRIYPRRHRQLATRIAERGALISEFPIGTPPRPTHFPQRNRIISGICLATLVVEADRRSGSLITARFAVEQNRDVFAVPGSIHSPKSHGCHELIRQGAVLAQRPADVLEELKIPVQTPAIGDRSQPTEVAEELARLLAMMGDEPVTVDTLVGRTGLTAGNVSSMLLNMELQGLVESFAGGGYIKVLQDKL